VVRPLVIAMQELHFLGRKTRRCGCQLLLDGV